MLLNLYFIPPISISTRIHHWIFIPASAFGLSVAAAQQSHTGISLKRVTRRLSPIPAAAQEGPQPPSGLGELGSPPAPFPLPDALRAPPPVTVNLNRSRQINIITSF